MNFPFGTNATMDLDGKYCVFCLLLLLVSIILLDELLLCCIRRASMCLFDDETQSSVTFDAWIPYERRHSVAPEFCCSTNCRNKNLFALIWLLLSLLLLKMCLTCSMFRLYTFLLLVRSFDCFFLQCSIYHHTPYTTELVCAMWVKSCHLFLFYHLILLLQYMPFAAGFR